MKQVVAKDMQTPGAENAKNAGTGWLYKWTRRSVAAGNATFEICSYVYARWRVAPMRRWHVGGRARVISGLCLGSAMTCQTVRPWTCLVLRQGQETL
jgi:hypothetical protein